MTQMRPPPTALPAPPAARTPPVGAARRARPGPQLARALRRFGRDSTGSVTAEFVIIFPVVMALLFLIAFVSMLVSAASDLQQLAHELSRSAFSLAPRKAPGEDLCNTLRTTVLPELLTQSLLLNHNKLTLLPCPNAPNANGYITVQVSYNFAGDYVANLGRSFGLNLGVVSRSSTTHF